MHPLRKHLDKVKANAPDQAAYRKSVLRLAAQVGIHNQVLNLIMNPNQKTSDLAPLKALRMENATNGDVPALTVCPKIYERIDEYRRILALADNLGYRS